MALTSMQLEAVKNALKGLGTNFSGAGAPTTAGAAGVAGAGAAGAGESPTGGGGVGKGDSVGTGTGMGTGAGMGTDSAAITDPNLAKAQSYADSLATMEKTPFSYSTANDPAYAAIQSENMKNSQMANRDMEEDMNSRGILNSTVTTDRATDIYKQGSDATTAAIPQLEAQAYGRHQQEIANQEGLITAYTGLSNTQNARDMQQATLTGRFMPPGAKPIIDAIIADKRAYGGASAEQQKTIAADAIAKRNMLAQYGIDPAQFGADVGVDQSLANEGYGAGVMTQAAKSAMANLIMGIGDRYAVMPDGIGSALSNLGGDYAQAGGLLDELKGVPNANYLINSMKNKIAQQRADAATTTADARVVSANKAGQGNAIASERLQMDKDKAVTDQSAKDDATRISVATNAEIAEAEKSKTRAEAYAYVDDNRAELSKRGVDIQAMLKAIDTSNRWPSPSNNTTTPGSSFFNNGPLAGQ